MMGSRLTRAESQRSLYLGPRCGAKAPQYQSVKSHPRLGASRGVQMMLCEKCGHRGIYDQDGREIEPGKDCSWTIWDQLDPDWQPPPLHQEQLDVDLHGAAARIGCSTDAVLGLIGSKKLKAKLDPQERVRIASSELERYLKDLTK